MLHFVPPTNLDDWCEQKQRWLLYDIAALAILVWDRELVVRLTPVNQLKKKLHLRLSGAISFFSPHFQHKHLNFAIVPFLPFSTCSENFKLI